MSLAEQIAPRSGFVFRHAFIPGLVLLAGLLCTALATLQLRALIEDAERTRFESLATGQTDAITDRIDTYVALLRGVAGLFSASGEVSAAEFRAYVERLQAQDLYPGVQGIGYAALVTPQNRDGLVARMRAENDPEFRVWPEGGGPDPASILYLEPGGRTSIGFDMFSEPVRRAAMEQARDTGVRSMSGKVAFVQDQGRNEEPGFLIFLPVYSTVSGAVPATVEERRSRISGWVFSPFRVSNLFMRPSLRENIREIEFSVYDGRTVDDANLLYHSGTAAVGAYEDMRTIEVAGHPWTIAVRSTPRFTPDSNRTLLPFVVAGGLLTTFLLFGASFAQNRAMTVAEHAREQLGQVNATLEQRVEERTAQLESARADLEGLNRNLETIIDTRTSDLKVANDEIQRFAYIVSHDLRSPLVNVMGFTSELEVARGTISKFYDEVVKRAPEAVDPDTKFAIETELPEAIDFIRSSTSKMDRLINAILRLSREGGRVLAPERIDMKKLIEATAQTLAHQVGDARAQLVVDDVPAIVSDRLAIEQIFTNLLENAVKYLAPERPGKIRVHGWQEGATVFIDVEDNGRGIDPKDHSRVFDLFRRAGVQDRAGEGIGLAHVRALVRRLGGTITLNSAAGEGSTFRVSLPAVMKTADEGDE